MSGGSADGAKGMEKAEEWNGREERRQSGDRAVDWRQSGEAGWAELG